MTGNPFKIVAECFVEDDPSAVRAVLAMGEACDLMAKALGHVAADHASGSPYRPYGETLGRAIREARAALAEFDPGPQL